MKQVKPRSTGKTEAEMAEANKEYFNLGKTIAYSTDFKARVFRENKGQTEESQVFAYDVRKWNKVNKPKSFLDKWKEEPLDKFCIVRAISFAIGFLLGHFFLTILNK